MKTCSSLPYAIAALLGRQIANIPQFSFPYLALVGVAAYFGFTVVRYCSLLLSIGEEVAGQAAEATFMYGLAIFAKQSWPWISSFFVQSASDASEAALPPLVDFTTDQSQSWVTASILGIAGLAGFSGAAGATAPTS